MLLKKANKVYIKVVLIVLTALVLSSCSIGRRLYDRPTNIFGVGSMMSPGPFEQINLVYVLDPENKGKDKYPDPLDDDEAKAISIAFDMFTTQYASSTRALRRNGVQERLLAASNQRCNYFKNGLQASRSGANFTFGSLATATGAAGAIVSGLASQILAGTAAIFSGVRAEYNQEFFSNVATHVVIQGIDLRRREIYEQIVLHGQAKPYDEYNVQAAVKDAVYYHGQCSVIAGIQFAADTIEVFDDPGIDIANRVLAKLKTTNRLLNERDLDPSEAIQLINTTDRLLSAGTTLGESKPSVTDPLDQLGTTLTEIGELSVAFTQAVEEQKTRLNAEDIEKLNMAWNVAQQRASTMLEVCRQPAAQASRALALARVELKQAELPPSTSASAVATAVTTARFQFQLQTAENQASKITSAIQQVRSLLSAHLDTAKENLQATSFNIAETVKAIEAMKDENDTCET